MDPAMVTASAAALGSLVGGAASAVTTWVTSRAQVLRAAEDWKRREREALYQEFVAEASRAALDAMQRSLERPDQLVALYGVLSRIRLISSDETLARAEECCRRIMDLYQQPNMTPDQFRAAILANTFDPIKEFSLACRRELLAPYPSP